MTVPLYAFIEGDTLGLLLLAQEGDSIADLIALGRRSARVRVAEGESVLPWIAVHQGNVLAPELTVHQAMLEPLARVDICIDRSQGVSPNESEVFS